MNPWWAIPTVLAGASLAMLLLYAFQRRHNDAGIVDVGWSLGIGAAVAWYALVVEADLIQRFAVAAVALPWSLRLGLYLLLDRVKGKEEDGRYRKLREHWGAEAQRKFLVFFQFQGLLIVLFSLPPLLAMLSPKASPLTLLLGVSLGLFAMAGESLSDAQLRRWRSNPANRGRTCREGLWRFSRHPNYFFEWLHWWAYVIMAGVSWQAAAALAGPLLMLLFLYRITGIPYTEAQALLSRGDDYREYQRTTSPFIPWFPRN
ncbi:MAG: hypothetical protein RLZZ303_1972 [Candidatus Hydrogenedentota bacterium]